MKHVSFHYTDEDKITSMIHWVMALGCYKDEVVMILIQSKVDSFPSLK